MIELETTSNHIDMKLNGTCDIFIVAGSDAYRSILMKVLVKDVTNDRSRDMRLRGFSSADACLDCLDEKPDIVIIDYDQPGERVSGADSMKLLRRIRMDAPGTDVLMTGGKKDIETIREFIRTGVNRCLPKDRPESSGVIRHAVTALMKKRRRKDLMNMSMLSLAAVVLMIAGVMVAVMLH